MEDFTYPQKLEYKIIPHFVMIRMSIVMLILETKFAFDSISLNASKHEYFVFSGGI
jgi:hypothetical protein